MICLEIVILFIYLFTYLVTFLALLVDCRVTVLQNKLLVIGMSKTPTFTHFTTEICLKSWRFERQHSFTVSFSNFLRWWRNLNQLSKINFVSFTRQTSKYFQSIPRVMPSRVEIFSKPSSVTSGWQRAVTVKHRNDFYYTSECVHLNTT